jgi:hypothetical protein
VNLRTLTFILVALWLVTSSAFGASRYSSEVQMTLDSALANRPQLEQALQYFEKQGDTLKLQAAEFLIANMRPHCYVTYYMHDSTGAEIPFDVLSFANYPALQTAADSIEKARGAVDFGRHDPIYDMCTMTADYLINQIEYAFRAWREKPWAQKLTWEQFRDYVLPYRGSNEPLEPWRQSFWEKHQGMETRMTNPSDPIEAARLINNDIKTWFGFDERYYYHPTDLGLTEMLKTHLGRCEDMTNVTIYAMRALGVGVTSDYTPYWANNGNNHAWNAIVTGDGRVIPFMGAEANPGEYQLEWKAAKIYRKMFAAQPDVLAAQPHKQDSLPGWLAGKSYRDVTREYMEVADVPVTFAQPVPDSVDIAYLCIFNSGEWKPIHWGRVKDNAAVFTEMGKGVIYLPALYLNKKVVPYGPAFLLDNDAHQTVLTPDSTTMISLKLTATTKKQQKASTEGHKPSALTPGQEYEVFYWNGEDWKSVAKPTATDQPTVVEGAPSGALYWLVAKGSDLDQERPFTLDSTGAQVWW